MSEHDKLPDELAELFAAERAAPVVDAATRTAARSRLAAAIAGLPLGKAAAAGVLGGGGKTLAVLAITVAAGAGTVELLTSEQPAITSKPPAAVIAPERVPVPHPPVPQREPIAVAMPAPAPSIAPERPRRDRGVVRATAKPPPVPPTQAQLLRRAWALVSTDQAAEALELARDDERLHPDGILAEEREALVVQALSKLRRTDDARAAAARFVARYPTSVHRAQIERALEESR